MQTYFGIKTTHIYSYGFTFDLLTHLTYYFQESIFQLIFFSTFQIHVSEVVSIITEALLLQVDELILKLLYKMPEIY